MTFFPTYSNLKIASEYKKIRRDLQDRFYKNPELATRFLSTVPAYEKCLAKILKYYRPTVKEALRFLDTS